MTNSTCVWLCVRTNRIEGAPPDKLEGMKSLSDIAAQLQGYDPSALQASAVKEFLAELVPVQTEVENLPLMQAFDRVLARDVISPISVPPHDNSAMDGYAFRGADLKAGEPSEFQVIGTALAGAAWQGVVHSGQCLKIMTGAVMPAGLDTVVPQEMCEVLPDRIRIAPGLLQTGDNRRLRGEDLMEGQVALAHGCLLSPAAMGLLASLNQATVPVFRRLRVAYFSTGDEVLSLGDSPREGAIYDSNRYTVQALLKRWGCEVVDLGVVRDEPVALEAAFRQAAAQADAVITSGGVSVGEADHTKAMMKKLGDVAFWKIAMRPGRPMAVGRIGQSILFGLPGNPVATMVTMLAFVRPALLRMSGARAQEGEPVMLQAASEESLRKKPGRTEYQRGWVRRAPDGRLLVRTTSSNQGSGVLSSMVAANGLIVLHHGQGNVQVGERVDVLMFEGVM
jgi:molybdopterin molybdotransferase